MVRNIGRPASIIPPSPVPHILLFWEIQNFKIIILHSTVSFINKNISTYALTNTSLVAGTLLSTYYRLSYFIFMTTLEDKDYYSHFKKQATMIRCHLAIHKWSASSICFFLLCLTDNQAAFLDEQTVVLESN